MIRRTANLVLLLGVGVVLCNGSVLAQPTPHTWTTTVEFQQGSFINLNDATMADQLQINTWQETKTSSPPVLPYLWVALSGRGTVVRIATSTFDPLTGNTVSIGQILGEYWSAPEGCRVQGNPNTGPSRTTVDFDGGVWVANRNNVNSAPSVGHVVKIGNGLGFQWKDRVINNPPILDTSTGLGDIKPWPNDNGVCEASDVQFAQDELILLYQPVSATGTRTIAVDRKNHVWVGGTGNRQHALLDGRTGVFMGNPSRDTCDVG